MADGLVPDHYMPRLLRQGNVRPVATLEAPGWPPTGRGSPESDQKAKQMILV